MHYQKWCMLRHVFMLNLTGVIFASVGFRWASVELPFCFRYARATKELVFRTECYVLESEGLALSRYAYPMHSPGYLVRLVGGHQIGQGSLRHLNGHLCFRSASVMTVLLACLHIVYFWMCGGWPQIDPGSPYPLPCEVQNSHVWQGTPVRTMEQAPINDLHSKLPIHQASKGLIIPVMCFLLTCVNGCPFTVPALPEDETRRRRRKLSYLVKLRRRRRKKQRS